MKMLVRLMLLGIIGLGYVVPAFAGDTRVNTDTPAGKFAQANGLYAAGDYPKAVAAYEDIIKDGWKTGSVYYNLGNAYFKVGAKGKAVLNYERAIRFLPKDNELKANLAFVRSSLAQVQPGGPANILEKAFGLITGILSPGGWVILCLVAYLLLFAVIIIAIFKRGLRVMAAYAGTTLGFVLLIFFVCFSYSAGGSNTGREAIVTVQETFVRYSPSYSGAMAFKLSEGIKVSVLRCENEWCQVRLTKDKSGWLEKETIEDVGLVKQ